MEYLCIGRTSGIEVTTGNITPIMKGTVVSVVPSKYDDKVIVKYKWLEVELTTSEFRNKFTRFGSE